MSTRRDKNCNDESCGCQPQLPRRSFLKLAGALTVGAAVAPIEAFAGPFHQASDSALELPLDKKLSQAWLASLTARGRPKTYRGESLAHIGMPIGGICAGMVYLGGDGKLWHWDIFNANKTGVTQDSVNYAGRSLSATEGAAYVKPIPPISEIHHGFWLSLNGKRKLLEAGGWDDISFVGQYPIGRVTYKDHDSPVVVQLEAFSPFIPLNEDDSGLPATLMCYRIENKGPESVQIELGGFLANPVGKDTCVDGEIERYSEKFSDRGVTGIAFRARPPATVGAATPDIDVETWSTGNYVGWIATGSAFGKGPILRKDVPDYQGDLGGPGDRVVNSHATAPGATVGARDAATGKLTGTPFTIDRNYLHFWIGGGNHPDETCLNLLFDGKIVRTATGSDSNRMDIKSFSVSELIGKTAHLEIVDSATGPWGNIGVGRIWQSDRPTNSKPLEKRPDFGTMALALLGSGQASIDGLHGGRAADSISTEATLAPGASFEAKFVVAWHFPNLELAIPDDTSGRYYGKRFADASAVAKYVSTHRKRLIDETQKWNRTWYDSTLPFWFLDRTFANTSTLATTTAHRFATGRFYAWEGVGCCAGTCTHVWHYAQAVGRLFPALERDLRERVDYGISFHPDTGAIGFRGEFYQAPAVDGQAGSILRTYREHKMSANSDFLTRVWPKAKMATQFLINRDPHGEGILEGAQDNTLDAAWFGKIAWTSSLYNAALRASAAMAFEMGDRDFGSRSVEIADKGKASIQSQLYNGEYFYQTHDPERPQALGTYDGCHVDQVMGQGWAWQVGLPRVLDTDKTVSALTALYKYNFTPDVGPFRKTHPEGRWYAMAGDGGLVMVTNPKNEKNPYGDSKAWQFGYFNECMSGFEHQVAAHMIAEGMITEGLAISRVIHDRYDASLRNPYNEIECSDHYARAMASYGSFVAMCGFDYHGPSGTISFDPRLSPTNFRAPFVLAEGWGTYEQHRNPQGFHANLNLHWGHATLKTFTFKTGSARTKVEVHREGVNIPSTFTHNQESTTVTVPTPIHLRLGTNLRFAIT